ncbi:ion-translocating oxidoreductase complex subunit C [Aedes albopictus]|uniref:Secreted protein n=1 Tax=Aedes albopictus TaxID=7160 RepID=A0ABM1YDQ0_AEDAL|nr:uncharacterized protein LOC109404946 [Aedes albopictus]XP_029735013.1 uncharacterized protein LOC109400613 [Aedes albopictus]
MSRRPGFRSRVYASNLGMVENNYKEAMARLERSRRPASADREKTSMSRASPLASKPLFDFNGDEFDEDLSMARARASKVIHEKSIIDSRSEQLRSHSLAPVSSSVLENDFDEQVQATLNRIRASKNILNQLQSDDTLEQVRSETRSKLSEHSAKKLAEKLSSYDDSSDLASTEKQSVRKTLKIRAVTDNSSALNAKSALKWKDETAESFAAKRASATKARLAELDQDMMDFEEKQAARARRAAHLKKVLAETACDELIPATTTEQAGTKVTTGMVRFKTQKKVVSF